MPAYYNCHTHSFNNSHVPEYFLSVKGLGRFAAKTAAGLIKITGPWLVKVLSVAPATKKYANFLAVGIEKTQDTIFEMVKAKYPAGTKIVVLPLNFEFMGAGKLKIPYVQQLAELIDLKKKYPDECLPFVCIDPRMGTAQENVDFVKKYIDIGFSGIKMYPSLGYYPHDDRLKLVYEYAQKNQVPVLTHCSRGGIHYVNRGKIIPPDFLHPSNLNPSWPVPDINVKSTNMGDFKNNFIKTESYEGVLQMFPCLKLCFAHFGVDDDNPYPTKNPEHPKDNWYEEIIRLMKAYKNVYTDISYSLTQDKFMKGFSADYKGAKLDQVKDKILFGTDFFMIEQEKKNDDNGLFNLVKAAFGQAEFDKLAGDNVAAFLKMVDPS
jgi:predicted TIM-barrel fold metal-dependent hydrolase